MQTWIVPGAPLADGWRIWYATDGLAPQPVTVFYGGQKIAVQWHISKPYKIKGFERTIFLATVRLLAAQTAALQPKPNVDPSYDIFIPEVNDTYQWGLLPARLPDEGTSFIFGSCFWQQDDAEGALLNALQDIFKIEQPRPAFKLLLGDQVYLDWPADVNPFRLAKGGYHLVGERYARYWGDDAYRRFLSLLPNTMIPDDHEFWNDFPERQVQLPITWTGGLKNDFSKAAHEYYDLFQAVLNPSIGKQSWSILELAPASLFVLDTRSQRSLNGDDPSRFMSKEQWDALESWQHSLTGPGLLAIGQPIFQSDGDWRDHSLSNFAADYRRLLALLKRSALGDNQHKTPHNIVLLSGDIHNARSTFATIPGVHDADFSRIYEFVASASSAIGPYVTTPTPSKLPAFIPEGRVDRYYDPRWRVNPVLKVSPADAIRNGTPFACIDNNLGLIRLKPATVTPYVIELEYVSYRIRPYRKPYFQLTGGAKTQTPVGSRQIYSQTLNLR